MEQFWTIFWSVVGIILTGLASWLSITLTNFFNSKIKDKKIAKIATDITNIIMNAVKVVIQTYVDTMKKAGKFTAEAAEEAMDRALKIIKAELNDEMLQYIKDNFGDVDAYLKNRVEAMIYTLKN